LNPSKTSNENAPQEAEHYLILVARGGIKPPTQGFSTPLLDSTSLSILSSNDRSLKNI